MYGSDQYSIKKNLKEILARPENGTCADCSSRKPTWASINLGIFLCLNCSGLHRNLGVHISKVRSVELDTWQIDWVENMSNVGNQKFNYIYEKCLRIEEKPSEFHSQNLGPEIRKFIRKKYVEKAFYERSNIKERSESYKTDRPDRELVKRQPTKRNENEDLLGIDLKVNKTENSKNKFEISNLSQKPIVQNKSAKVNIGNVTNGKSESYDAKAARVMALFN